MLTGNHVLAWKIVFTSQSQKDSKKIKTEALRKKISQLLDVIPQNPYVNPLGLEKLKGTLNGYYSRSINIQHRLIYKVYEKEHTLQIIRMWTHYE